MGKKYHELTSEEKMKGWITLFVMAFLILFYFKCCSNDEKSVEVKKAEVVLTPEQKSKQHTKTDAFVEAISVVRNQLKAPSTADFGYDSENGCKQMNDSSFVVKNYVDSENSFGAKLRSEFLCLVYYTSDNKVHVEILEFKQP